MPTRAPVHIAPGHLVGIQARRAFERERGSSTKRGYDRTWQKARLSHLMANPLCVDCHAAGLVKPAEEVHHIAKVRDRPDLRLDDTNLMGLCAPCHSVRTARGE